MSELYPVYEIEYGTISASPLYAIVSDKSEQEAGKLLENSFSKSFFDKIYKTKDTGFKADKKGIIFPKL